MARATASVSSYAPSTTSRAKMNANARTMRFARRTRVWNAARSPGSFRTCLTRVRSSSHVPAHTRSSVTRTEIRT